MADTRMIAGNAVAELKPTRDMLDLYNDYAHDVIDRRTFMERLSKYAVGGVTLAMLTEMLMPKYATALQLAEDDPRIRGERIEYKQVAVHTYPDTQHGFHNDTTPRFSPEQARIAWNRTLEFWDKHLL